MGFPQAWAIDAFYFSTALSERVRRPAPSPSTLFDPRSRMFHVGWFAFTPKVSLAGVCLPTKALFKAFLEVIPARSLG